MGKRAKPKHRRRPAKKAARRRSGDNSAWPYGRRTHAKKTKSRSSHSRELTLQNFPEIAIATLALKFGGQFMVDLARSFGFNVPFAAVAAPLGVYAITSKFNVPIHGLKTVAAVEIVNQVINNTKLAQIFSNTTVAPVQASKGFMGAMAERTPLDVRKQLANLHREYSGQYVQQRSGLTQERNGMGRKYLR